MDFYCTPAWCVEGVYKALSLPRPTLDPGAGNGGLVGPARRIHGSRSKLRGVEIQDELAQQARDAGLDVATGDGMAIPWTDEHILMNPPYRDAMAWVEKGVSEASSVLALLRLGFLSSLKRQDFMRAHPPKALAICSRRPSFIEGKGGDSADYAWFYWSKQGGLFETRLVWIS